jgi:FMN-dependent NADH-azoreductase
MTILGLPNWGSNQKRAFFLPLPNRRNHLNRLLFIQSSPRHTQSKSNQIAQAYLSELCENNPDLSVDVLSVWDIKLPVFDGDKVGAKLATMQGKQHTASEKTAWDQIVGFANRFITADRYLMAVPMWNSGIPYPLKHYIDVIHQPGLLWGLKPESGYFGLLQNKHATLVLTAGAYSPSAPSPAFGTDHHSSYLRDWLNQAGVTAIDEVRFEPTLLTADPVGDLERAKGEAVALARVHGRVDKSVR